MAQFQKGVSGNPGGRPMKGNTMVDIFEGILDGRDKEFPDTPKKQTCKKLLTAMRNGEAWAIKEILHMTMGMPIQKQVLTGLDEGPLRLIIRGSDDREITDNNEQAPAEGSDNNTSNDPED